MNASTSGPKTNNEPNMQHDFGSSKSKMILWLGCMQSSLSQHMGHTPVGLTCCEKLGVANSTS